MSVSIPLSSDALIRIFNLLNVYPADDTGRHHGPWGPYGPGGPVLGLQFQTSQDLARQEIRPQPQPSRYASLAREAAQYVLRLHDVAIASSAKNADEASIKLVQDIDEEVCGNDLRWLLARFHLTPHHPEPPDPPIRGADPIEIAAFGVQFLAMGKLLGDTALGAAFTRAGEHIATAGLEAAGRAGSN